MARRDQRADLLATYRNHLLTTCGVTHGTRELFVWHVTKFLTARYGSGRIDVGALKPADVIRYVTTLAPRYSSNTRKSAVSALRSFLRWLQLTGRCASQLVDAVPTVSSHRQSGLPTHLSETELATLLRTFDRGTARGLRGYAAALCRDVGRAIVAYLRKGRPATARRHVFGHHHPPYDQPAGREALRGDIYRAFQHADLCTPSKGTRILRHTTATHLIQRGAPLKSIADVLGHRSIDTTAIYAKVNLPALREVGCDPVFHLSTAGSAPSAPSPRRSGACRPPSSRARRAARTSARETGPATSGTQKLWPRAEANERSTAGQVPPAAATLATRTGPAASRSAAGSGSRTAGRQAAVPPRASA